MAADICRKRLRDEGTCSICLDYFTDPVTLDCGHNFCRVCIIKFWEEASTEATCPQCRERVRSSNLRPNRQLANMVEIARELSELRRQEAGGQEICERHQEPLKLFCQDDEAPVCVVCDRSKEHRAHRVVPVEEAAQEIKDQICRSLETLRKERENILVYKAENEKESQDLIKQMEAEREKTTAVFRQQHQFQKEQEKLLLSQTERVEKEIARRRDKHLALLSGELSSLDSLIWEMEEKQKQSASELLQNIGNILERCKKVSFENPVAFPPSLKWRIHDFCDINPFLEALMKQYQESVVSGLKLQEAKVILDPDTAHPELILSEDCKSVRWEDEYQDLPDNPERFDGWTAVLGCEGFTTGRYFWEVDVGNEEEWAVGVARKSVRRKGEFKCSPEEGIWDLGKWAGEYRVSVTRDHPHLSLSEKVQKVRVTLNCPGGRLAFFDADTGAELFVYKDASLCRETLFPFFFVLEGGHLTLCP
ncbi:zinc finger protein RFP-like [Tiliqua scincoides]|uniref:zinc finger protein RFP-like n=1 Tax=Tiliqua scincoides TaxID=71010 RepID=UPI003463201D